MENKTGLSKLLPPNYKSSSLPTKLIWNLIFIIIISFATIRGLTGSFNRIANKAISKIENYYNYSVDSLNSSSSSFLTTTDKITLIAKVKQLQKKKKIYQHLFIVFGKNNYALLSLFPILSIITAILGFFIAQKGWGSSDTHIKAYFLLFTALTTLVGIFPSVYNQEAAMNDNIAKFNNITGLQDKVFHYAQTAPILYGDTVTLIHLIDTINYQETLIDGIEFKVVKVNSSESIQDKLITPNN